MFLNDLFLLELHFTKICQRLNSLGLSKEKVKVFFVVFFLKKKQHIKLLFSTQFIYLEVLSDEKSNETIIPGFSQVPNHVRWN